jgi:WD40 repeat protein
MLSPSVRIYPLELNDKEKRLGAIRSTFYATTTVESLRFSPCGRYLAIGQRYQPVLIHELATGNLLAAVATDSRNRSVDFSADGELCLVVGEGNDLLLASSQTGHIQHRHTCPVNPQFACFSPLSGWIAYTAYEDPQVYLSYHSLADPESVGPSFVLTQQRGIVSSLDFSQDGRWLVAGTRRGGVVKWNLESLLTSVDSHQSADPINCVAEFVAHSGEVTDVCTVRGTHIASVSNSGSVVLNPLPVLTVSRTGNDVTAALAMGTPADMHMLQGTSDGRVVLANLSTASNRELCGATHSPVTTIGRSPDGQRGAIGWGDGRIALVDLATQDLIPCDYAPPGDSLDERRINSLAFNHDGSMLAACGDDARLRIWSVADPSRNCWETTLTSFAYTTCFCGPQRVAVGGMFEDIWVYDLGSGQPAYRLPGSGRTVSLMFDHSRERLISGHADGRIRIHSGPQWQHVDTLNGDAGKINCLVGSPGWDCYISGDSQGQIKVWSAEHLELIGNLHTLADASSITSMELDQQRQELMVFFATRLPEGSAPESQCNYVRLNGR